MSVFSMLSRAFPLPRFLTLPAAGIAITETSLIYLTLRGTPRRASVARWGQIPIPAGAIVDGGITHMATLVAVLKKTRERTGTPYVRVALPEERAYLFETELSPDMPTADMQHLLEFRMQEHVPLPPRDVALGYDIAGEDTRTKAVRLAVGVYPKETVTSYYDACVAAGMFPLSLEIEIAAAARAVIPKEENGAFLIVDIGEAQSSIGITLGQTIRYTSTIDIGGRHFNEALRRSGILGDVDEARLAALKNERGLLAHEEKDNLYEALLPPVAALREEIAKRLEYWDTHGSTPSRHPIEKVLLTGSEAALAGLPEYLSETLGVVTERADVWRAVPLGNRIPPIEKRLSYAYATAVGLALIGIQETSHYD